MSSRREHRAGGPSVNDVLVPAAADDDDDNDDPHAYVTRVLM